MNTKMPLDTDVGMTQLGNKKGMSSVHSLFWLFAWGDGGTQAAAQDAGITTITHLDRQVYQVLFGVYTKVDTIAYGD